MKKTVAFAISILMLMQILTLPVYAANERIEANTYSDGTVSGTYDNCIGMNRGERAAYSFTISESGIYDVVISAATDKNIVSETPSMTFRLDGKEYNVTTKITDDWNTYSENKVLTGVPLDGGTHRAELFMHGSANIAYIEFVKLSEIVGVIKQFEDYADGGEGVAYHDTVPGADSDIYSYTRDDVDIGPAGSGKVVAALDGEWIKYDIDVPYTGDYTFEICYAKPDEIADMTVDAYPQRGKAVSTVLKGTGAGDDAWQKFKYSEPINIPLKAGKQTVKLCFGGNAVNLDYFMFTLNTELYSIVNKINNSDSFEQIYETVTENKSLFGDITEKTKDLFYPQIAMRGLINQNFCCFEEVKERAWAAVENELAGKSVKLTADGKEVTEYKPGTLKVNLKIGFTDYVTLVYAIYSGNKLEYIYLNKSTKSNASFTVRNFNYDEGKDYTTKILIWEKKKYSPSVSFSDGNFDESIYVSPEGSDSAAGGIVEPVATIEKAKLLARELSKEKCNVNVYISGKYNILEPMMFTPEDSAYSGKTINYIGDVAAEINGGTEVTGWEKYDENLYRAKLDVEDMRQFYVNGSRKQRAKSRLINKGDFKYWYDENNVTGDKPAESGSGKNTAVDPEADGFDVKNSLIPAALAGKDGLEIVSDLCWATQRLPVDTVTRGEKYTTFKMKQPYFYICMAADHRYLAPSENDSFYIENAFEFLDEPGEFWFDKETKYLYYYPQEGEKLKNCYAAQSEGYIKIKGTSDKNVSGLNFTGLTFKYGTWLEPNEKGIVSTQADCLFTRVDSSALSKWNAHLFAQIEAVYADNINITNNKFQNTGSTVIGFREAVSNSNIKNNIFEDTSGAAIMLGSWMQHYPEYESEIAKNITVSDNTVKDVAVEYCGSVGIGAYYVQNTEIEHNTISNAAYSGISLGWGWGNTTGTETYGNTVIGNRIMDVMKRVSDGAHIYTLGYLKDCVISDNYCSKSYNKGQGGGGIYLDSGSAYITIENNVIEETVYWLFAYNYSQKGITARNNWYKTEKYIANMTDSVYENNTDCREIGYGEEALNVINNSGVRN